MTLNQRIIQALKPLGLPVVPDVDTLHRPRCLVFNYNLIQLSLQITAPLGTRH